MVSYNFFLLDMFDNKDVTEWTEAFDIVDMPVIQFSCAALFSKILLLQYNINETIAIGEPLMGKLRYLYILWSIIYCLPF